MKILQINNEYKYGSTGKIVESLQKKAVENGFKCFIGYGRSNSNEENSFQIGSKLDLYLHGIGTRIFDKHGLYSKKATQKFLELIDKFNIDIFHLHNIHGYYLNYPLLFEYLKQKNKPVIWTLHDCWAFTGHCSHYEYIRCDKWQSECFSCPQKRRYPASLIVDNSKNNYNLKKKYFTSLKNLTIVTPSFWLANQIKKSFLKSYDIKVIYNGIDLEIFRYRESNFRKKYNIENKFIILGVASVWNDRKGFEYFIKLSNMIKKDEIIVLIGLNETQLKKLPKNVIGIKRTDNQIELSEIYSSANVFVNPTLEEVLGLTNLESLACGTPVITFDSGGSSECINEKTGLVVPKDDINSLYQAIQKIKKIGSQKFKKDCRSRVEKYFDKNKNFEEYLKLYREKGEI